jgi:hypothetical protein
MRFIDVENYLGLCIHRNTCGLPVSFDCWNFRNVDCSQRSADATVRASRCVSVVLSGEAGNKTGKG